MDLWIYQTRYRVLRRSKRPLSTGHTHCDPYSQFINGTKSECAKGGLTVGMKHIRLYFTLIKVVLAN
jgi:hypothetical protein